MYPKVVPVAVKEPVAGAPLHNFVQGKLRISQQVSGNSPDRPKRVQSF
jgi:hypothetical protein